MRDSAIGLGGFLEGLSRNDETPLGFAWAGLGRFDCKFFGPGKSASSFRSSGKLNKGTCLDENRLQRLAWALPRRLEARGPAKQNMKLC